MSTQPQALARLYDVGYQLRTVEPMLGHFVCSAVGMARSGELALRQCAAATLSVANRLEPHHRAFADQLRGAVEALLAPRLTDAPAYARPISEPRRFTDWSCDGLQITRRDDAPRTLQSDLDEDR